MEKKAATGGLPVAAGGGVTTVAGGQPQDSTNPQRIQQHISLAALLAAEGAGFCLIPQGGKAPFYKGWQRSPKPLEEARAHAKRGGNVGMLGGAPSAGLVVLDFDADVAGALRALPALTRTIRIYRDNAPERGKFVVRCVDGEPPNVKHKASGTEIIATGGQGVIHGTHPSGARIKWSGERVAEVTLADLAALWQQRTGEQLGGRAARADAGPADAEAVDRSLRLVDKVLELANVERDGWQAHEGSGRKAILKQCPFQPEDDPHVADAGAAVLVGADGRIGAVCHHARCQERIAAAGGNGWALLKEIAGYRPPTTAEDQAHARAVVDALRAWIRRADFAEHVPVVLQACNGYRTNGTDKALADAILDQAHKWGRLVDLPLSLRSLRSGAGLGSPATARTALARLRGWFVVEDDAGGAPAPARAPRFSLAAPVVQAAEDQLAQIDQVMSGLEFHVSADTQRSIYASSPLATHRAHDAFVQSLSPMTPAQLAAENERRAAEGVPAMRMTGQLRRRLAADLPSAGRNVLLLVDALATDGPSLSRAELGELTHLSACAVSRAVKRAAVLGLVDADRRTVDLRSEWGAQLQEVTPRMPTAGRSMARAIADADAVIRFASHRLRAADCTEDERARMHRRIARATHVKAEIARMEGATKAPPAWAAPKVRPGEAEARMQRLRTLVAMGEQAAAAKPMTREQALEFALYHKQIEERWDEFNAWLTVDLQEPGWWTQRAPVDIVRHYKRFLAAGEPPAPSIRFEAAGVGHD